MRKTIYLIFSILLVLTCVACTSVVSNSDNGEKYSLNISYGLGGDLAKTVLSFDANIGGIKSDVKNIDAYEILINAEYMDLLLENGPYNSKHMADYMQITGTIVFDASGMTKEDIGAINIFEGIRIIDKDGNGFDIYLPLDQEAVE